MYCPRCGYNQWLNVATGQWWCERCYWQDLNSKYWNEIIELNKTIAELKKAPAKPEDLAGAG